MIRNVAKAFRFLRFSESIGSGFHKMIYGWNKQYKLKPIINGDFDFYKITFPFDETGTTVTNTVTNVTNTVTNTDDKIREILDIIEKNPSLNRKEIGNLVNLSGEGVGYHLDNLKKKGKIERVGHGKGGSWRILK